MAENKPQKDEISGENFPALRAFLRGYFHQDMAEEYDSPEEAAQQFCEDADSQERIAVATEWKRFIERTKGQPLDATNALLTRKLGSAIKLSDDQVSRVSAVFARHLRR
jgi:hypothetical protein